MDLAANAKRRWGIEKKDIEEIFDISDEIELLKEIKDIRDELNILRTLYDQQSHVLNSYSHASGRRPQPSDMEDAVKRLTNIVEKMDVDAQRPYKAVSIAYLLRTYSYIGLQGTISVGRSLGPQTETSERIRSANRTRLGKYHHGFHNCHDRIPPGLIYGGLLRTPHSRISLCRRAVSPKLRYKMDHVRDGSDRSTIDHISSIRQPHNAPHPPHEPDHPRRREDSHQSREGGSHTHRTGHHAPRDASRTTPPLRTVILHVYVHLPL